MPDDLSLQAGASCVAACDFSADLFQLMALPHLLSLSGKTNTASSPAELGPAVSTDINEQQSQMRELPGILMRYEVNQAQCRRTVREPPG